MEPSRPPVRQTTNLYKGRVSLPGARYFITMVTQGRQPWLMETQACRTVLNVLQVWHAENQGSILAATVMPDHAHVLFALGPRLTVGQTIARWKSGVRKQTKYAGDFQRDFWEHLLRRTRRH